MSRRVSSSQSNKTLQFKGLSEYEISQVEKLSIFEQAEKIKSILESTKRADDLRLAHKINNEQKLEELERDNPKNMNEINRISMIIDNLKAEERRFRNKIEQLELNLDERIHIIDELLKSEYGRAVVLLPPASKGRGLKKKKRTRKRKKGKKGKKRKTKK
jgi:vacuolar-type H+-ATPase subunit I/STV1